MEDLIVEEVLHIVIPEEGVMRPIIQDLTEVIVLADAVL